MNIKSLRPAAAVPLAVAAAFLFGGLLLTSSAQTIKGQPIKSFLSSGGLAGYAATHQAPRGFAMPIDEGGDDGLIPPDVPLLVPDGITFSSDYPGRDFDFGGERNVFANDPCLDPPPPDRRRTVQSETTLASLYDRRWIGVGYNDSWGFYDNRQGLSGYAYSIDGGRSFIDAGALPPLIPTGLPAGTPGQDAYYGDPVIVVHEASQTFYYSSIYRLPNGTFSLSVNRGHFLWVPPQKTESQSNTRCLNHPALYGVPDPPPYSHPRLVWEPPVVAVPVVDPGDFLDKEWLYVDQETGELYLAYVRFGTDGSTPLELVRSKDGGHTWIGPTVIVPNLDDTFNTAVQPTTVWGPHGKRVVLTWYSRTFALSPPFPEISDRIEYTYSDDDGATFAPTKTVSPVNPQGEPPGYNRGRTQILDTPFISTWGPFVYITYFSGRPGSPLVPGTVPGPRPSDIWVSTSHDGGQTFGPPVRVNNDNGQNSHVFQNVSVNAFGIVMVSWQDRRLDPKNVLTDTWASFSVDGGRSFTPNERLTDVSTSWFVRADARPNFGDYNSSALLDGVQFMTTWGDGRFPPGTFVPTTCTTGPPCAPVLSATPDTMFTVVPFGGGEGGGGSNGQGGNGNGGNN